MTRLIDSSRFLVNDSTVESHSNGSRKKKHKYKNKNKLLYNRPKVSVKCYSIIILLLMNESDSFSKLCNEYQNYQLVPKVFHRTLRWSNIVKLQTAAPAVRCLPSS